MVLATQAQAENGVRERLVAEWAMVQKLFFRPLLGSAILRGGMNEGNEQKGAEVTEKTEKRSLKSEW